MRSDLGAELIQAALDTGLISAEDHHRAQALVKDSGGKLYAAQVLVRERMISCEQLLELQNSVQAKVYECPRCQRRYARKSLPKKKGKAFTCKGCKKKVVVELHRELTRLEVLTSRDPLDLTVSLGAAGEVSHSSEVSNIDLDRYEINEELGRGGYGVVFKAFHKDLQREIALKVLRPSKNLPHVTLERFIREGRSASRLKHPNLVGVYDIGRSREIYALAMEFVPGKSLREHLQERTSYPWREALELMDEVLQGVAHAHEQGIIHRDLKPTNIIIDETDGRPRIIDFGLAKDLHSEADLTQAGAIVGTPYYLSPEQIKGRSSEADARSDVFALGVILYLLLCGKRPFQSNLKTEVYAKILNDEPTPLGELCEIPPELEDVVATAMAKKAEDRYEDAGAFRKALQEVAAGGASSNPKRKRSSKSGLGKSGLGKKSKRTTGKRKRTAAAAPGGGNGPKLAIAAAAVVGVLALGFMAGSGGASPDEPEAAAAAEPEPEAPTSPPKATTADPEPSRPEVPPEARAPLDPEPTGPEPLDPAPLDPAPLDPAPLDPEPLDPAPEPTDLEPTGPEPTDPEPAPPSDPEPPPPADPPADPAVEPPTPPPLAQLDEGKTDAEEFPRLAERSPKEWLKRAFMINALAEEDPPSPYTIRGLRFALNDRSPLNRAFALRGLARCESAAFLRAHGSKALFDALVDMLDTKEPYVQRTTQVLLLQIADVATPRKKSAWKTWWSDEGGEALFREAATNPPVLKGQRDAVQAKGREQALRSETRTVTEYFSKLRKGGLDLLFVIDVTLSMTDELKRMREQVNEITSFMDLLLHGKVRMGFVTYGDAVVKRVPLTKRLDAFAREVEEIQIFNDPNDRTVPEGVGVALEDVLHPENRVGWRKRSTRTILLLGDAPPLDADKARTVAAHAGKNGYTINTLLAPPPAKYAGRWPPKPIFEEIAKLGGGLSAELGTPEELITRILVFAFGSKQEADLRRFVFAYREVTGKSNGAEPQ